MLAIRIASFGPPDVMKLEEVEPLAAKDGHVLIRLHAAGVNPVDDYIRSGTYAMKPDLPYTPGMDGAGVIEAIGAGVNRPDLRPGQRVWLCRAVTGTYAQQTVAEPIRIAPLPERLTFEQGAAVGVAYLTAHTALMHKARLQPGEVVLIHGASGGVGTAAVQIARAMGAIVVGTAGTEQGRELVRQQGAHIALDHTTSDYLDSLRGMTGGRGPDVIIEMLANKNLQRDLECLAPRGRITIVGSRGALEINPRAFMAKDATVTGMALFNATQQEWTQSLFAVNEGLRNGTLTPVVGEVMDLKDAPAAHRRIMEPGSHGKIVLRVG